MTGRPLTIEETIETLGISDKTVRRMLKEGLLQEHSRDGRNRILITPGSIAQVAEHLKEQRGNDEPRGHDLAVTTQAAALERAVETLSQLLQDRDARLVALLEENALLKAERRFLPSADRVRELEEEVVRLRAELGSRPVTDQPGKSIRKGWLRRWFGRDQAPD